MNKIHNDWTEQMRQRLGDARADVPDGLWAAIENKLDEQDSHAAAPVEKPRRRVVAMWRWAAAASVVAALGVGLWWQTRDGALEPGGVRSMGVVADGQGEVASATAATDMARRADGGAAALGAARQCAAVPTGASRGSGVAVCSDMALDAAPLGAETAAAAIAEGGGTVDGRVVGSPALGVAARETSEPASKQTPAQAPAQARSKKTGSRTTAMLRSEPMATAAGTARDGSRWQVGMATAGSMSRYTTTGGVVAARPVAAYMDASAKNNVLFAAEPMLNAIKESTHHDMPVAVGLTASYRLTDRLALTSGLVYTLATSSFEHGTSGGTSKDEQSLHYIGIPLSASYEVWGNRRVQTYVTAGGQADFNVSAKVTTEGHTADTGKDRAQLSVGGGVGVQLNVVKQLGIYVEPGVKYYFDNGSKVQNVFKDHPCNFSLQVGVRYNITH